jgi:hypothetical protein
MCDILCLHPLDEICIKCLDAVNPAIRVCFLFVRLLATATNTRVFMCSTCVRGDFVARTSPGKSAFSVYCLARRLQMKSGAGRILYQYGKLSTAFMFVPPRLFSGVEDPLASADSWRVYSVEKEKIARQLLSGFGVVYICDGAKPEEAKDVPTLLVTSPRYSTYKEFVKSPGVECVSVVSVAIVNSYVLSAWQLSVREICFGGYL